MALDLATRLKPSLHDPTAQTAEESALLQTAKMAALPVLTLVIGGAIYDVDLRAMMQSRRSNGNKRRIRVQPPTQVCPNFCAGTHMHPHFRAQDMAQRSDEALVGTGTATITAAVVAGQRAGGQRCGFGKLIWPVHGMRGLLTLFAAGPYSDRQQPPAECAGAPMRRLST
eukprot:SAG11_NODE_466_length_9212_cov_2.301986_5_plen_170_part_00